LVHHQNFFADTIGHNHFLIVILGSHPTNSLNLPSGAADLDGNHSFGNHAFAHGVNPLPLLRFTDRQAAADLADLGVPYPVETGVDRLTVIANGRHQDFPQFVFHRLFKSSANPLISLTRIKPMFNEYSMPLWSIKYIPIGRPFRAHEVLSHWRLAGLPQSNSTRNRFSGRCKTSTS